MQTRCRLECEHRRTVGVGVALHPAQSLDATRLLKQKRSLSPSPAAGASVTSGGERSSPALLRHQPGACTAPCAHRRHMRMYRSVAVYCITVLSITVHVRTVGPAYRYRPRSCHSASCPCPGGRGTPGARQPRSILIHAKSSAGLFQFNCFD
jgi:hypothetical protein